MTVSEAAAIHVPDPSTTANYQTWEIILSRHQRGFQQTFDLSTLYPADATSRYAVAPQIEAGLQQNEEYFLATLSEKRERIRLHDYDTIYRHAWLYEAVLYDKLSCRTPAEICRILNNIAVSAKIDLTNLNVLDLGGGSGIFSAALRTFLGIKHVSGLDISQEAKEAAKRDRPGIYDSYYNVDLTALTRSEFDRLISSEFDCVGVASATGWNNHIPVTGFATAFQILRRGGIFIFHVKRDPIDPECQELYGWMDDLINTGMVELLHREECFHRKSVDGASIFYDVVVSRKH